MLRYIKLTQKNFKLYRRLIIFNETFFHPKIRTKIKEYEKFDRKDTTYLMFKGNIFIGDISGYEEKQKVFYLFKIFINPKNQGKGYGRKLLKYFMKRLKLKGYTYLKGHFNNKSIYLLNNLNCKVIKVYKNWENTNQEYRLIKIKL